MPSERVIYKLMDLADIGSSKRIFKSDYTDNGIPFYRSKEIIQKSLYEKIEDIIFISRQKFSEIKERFGAPSDGDILLSSVGNRSGIPYLVNKDGDFYFKDGNLLWFRNFDEKVNSSFLVHWLKSSIGQHRLNSLMIGSAQKALTIEGVRSIDIELPPLQEQKAIASILSAIDDKIELNLQMNKTLEEMAMTLYKHWFVDFGPFKDGKFVESELGMIPEGWEVKKIKDTKIYTSDYVANGSFKSLKENVNLYDDRKEFALFIRNTDLKTNFNGKLKYVDKNSYNFLSKTKLFGRELIISNVGDVGSVYLVPPRNEPMTLGNNVIMIKGESLNNYLFSFFKSRFGQHCIKGITGGSAQPKFNKTDFRNLEILFPSEQVINNFNKNNNPIQEKIFHTNSENKILVNLRNTLLPKLISGQVRLKEFEKQISEAL